jgi:hypothetical protein
MMLSIDMSAELNYWAECLCNSAEENGIQLTNEQLNLLANDVKIGHEYYGQAFYSPPASDRYHELEREYKKKVQVLENELATFRRNAETAIKQALRVHVNDPVSIGEYGEVLRHGGRTERIQ